MSETNRDTRPAWIDQWTNALDDGRPYDCATIAHMRAYARANPDVRGAMVQYLPHCVITLKVKDEITYGVVTGVCTIEPDKPVKAKKRGLPERVIALRIVPTPLHMAGATSTGERDASYVMLEGVDVVGYAPRFTPATMRAFIAPAGLA